MSKQREQKVTGLIGKDGNILLGYAERVIKNVQPKAKAVLTESEFTYRTIVLDKSTKVYQQALEKIDEAFQSIFQLIEGKGLVDQFDNGNDGFLFEVLGNLPEIAISLLGNGSVYSNILKNRALVAHPELKATDFETTRKGGKKSEGEEADNAPAVEIELSEEEEI